MRFIHTSDWHLGRSLHAEPLLEHQAEFLRWLFELAQARAVDAVVVAGDIYDRAVPHLDAVRLLDRTLAEFARAGIPILLIGGNHDSAVRLGFGRELSESAGVHLRTAVADVDRPLVVTDKCGPVAIYGIPYLLPDAAMSELEVEVRSHHAVLQAAMDRIRRDAAQRGITRTVVAAHAFVTGGVASESERDIRIGGIADAPVSVFDGVSYAALGHLHGAQRVSPPAASTTARYSGSPLAFSFSERHQAKSVAVVEIDAVGAATAELVPVPVARSLREVRGRLDELLVGGGSDPAELADAWVKVVLTDPARPHAPMERLRTIWPHTLVLEFAPEMAPADAQADLARLERTSDPREICELFVAYAGGSMPTRAQQLVLREVVEAAELALMGTDP